MVSAGTMARAVASGISAARFNRAAASSTATTFSSLLILAATTMGSRSWRGASAPATACDKASWRLKRSVGSRGNHRHNRRRLVDSLLEEVGIAVPVHDPAAGLAVTVA